MLSSNESSETPFSGEIPVSKFKSDIRILLLCYIGLLSTKTLGLYRWLYLQTHAACRTIVAVPDVHWLCFRSVMDAASFK